MEKNKTWRKIIKIGNKIQKKWKNLFKNEKLNITNLAIFAAFSGFLFDWIVSLSILHNVDTSFFLIYLLNGVPFDLLHAGGNVVFVTWFANPLSELMNRHTNLINSEAVPEFAPN